MVLVLLGGAAAAEDGSCAEERERLSAVQRSLGEHEQSPSARATAEDWAVVVRETCTWADAHAPAGTDCVVHTCARLHADDRLAWVAPGWDAATFARVTGDQACTPDAGPSCAVAAADAADVRLRSLVETLQVRGDSPDVAQIAWSRYRDAACREDALAAPDLRAWTSAACRAVLTIRRADLLTRLAQDSPR